MRVHVLGGPAFVSESLHVAEAHRGYVACAIDSEGCLRIAKSGQRVDYAVLVVVNTNKEMVEKLRSWTGVGSCAQRGVTQGRKPRYEWRVGGPGLRRIVYDLRDLFIVKRTQVETLIEFWNGRPSLRPGERLPQAERLRRDNLHRRLTLLNSGGVR